MTRSQGPTQLIAVVGSINMDLVLELDRLPKPGETVSGGRLAMYPGGKGANQAVAAARLGSHVAFYGAVGDDAHGEQLLRGLVEAGVDVASAAVLNDIPSGLATIWVDAAGENAIAVASGANAHVDRAYVDRHLDRIASSDILLLQLEIPIDTVAYLLRALPEDGPQVILDPAPACDVESLPLSRIDILKPNARELATLAGTPDPEAAASALLSRGVRNIVCTLGEEGATWYTRNAAPVRFPAPHVDVIDTTAAGDAFGGALAWALLRSELPDAIPMAVAAGSLATTVRGAQPSLPGIAALRRLCEAA